MHRYILWHGESAKFNSYAGISREGTSQFCAQEIPNFASTSDLPISSYLQSAETVPELTDTVESASVSH